MSIEITMAALSPTMEKGTLTKWLVKEGDAIRIGDILAAIETNKGERRNLGLLCRYWNTCLRSETSIENGGSDHSDTMNSAC